MMTDLRFGLRMLSRNPGSTALIVMLLALGIGASTAIFSLFDAVLLRPLPVHHPEELVRMIQQLPKLGARSEFPYAYYRAVHGHAATLAITFGETGNDLHLRITAPGAAEQISMRAVTPGFFDALGVRALYGRTLKPDDAIRRFDAPSAVLSYGFWRRRFRGNPQAVRGQTVSVNGHRLLIVGVMPREFNGLSIDTAPDIRVPLQAIPLLTGFKIDSMYFEQAARLKPGITRSRAAAECLTIWRSTMPDYYRSLERESPKVASALVYRGMTLEPLARGVSVLRDRYGDVLKLLMASVTLLVLIVCLNVAGLLVARAATRQREIAVRLAIGATRFQIARQMFVESLLLAGIGTLGGFVIALAIMPLTVRLLPPVRALDTTLVPLSVDAGANWRVFLFLSALAILITLIFALSPALAASRTRIDSVLRAVHASGSCRGRQILIASQIAVCTFLLVGASLFVRTFEQLRGTNPGFARDSVATFTADLTGYPRATAYLSALKERVRELPGVVSIATSSTGVMRGHGISATVVPAGQVIGRGDFMDANVNAVSPEYFQTMGMHIVAGRDYAPADTRKPDKQAPTKIIVNEAMVRRFFPNTDPIGKRLGTGVEGFTASASSEIIGVVSDAKYRSLREPIRPTSYPLETDFDAFVLNVRTRARAEEIIPAVQHVAFSIGPELPFVEVHTLAEEVEASTAPERMTATVAFLFGCIALLLAGAGTYGLLAYVVVQRRREIGVRMALGATPRHVVRLIARQTFVLTVCGIAAGLGASLPAAFAMQTLLYKVSPQDPSSLATTAIFVAAVAAAATLVPTLEAVQIEPADALRLEN